jgi:predicted RNA-binding Zn-ribbon protein involved in translation (DUF1610 family)
VSLGRGDYTVFHCDNCGREVNPYTELDAMGVSPEQVFNWMRAYYSCPACGKKEWIA